MSSTEDHALGLELQLIELVEKQQRAAVQHRDSDAAAVQAEIDAVQAELADTGEALAEEGPPGAPHFHDVDVAGQRLAS